MTWYHQPFIFQMMYTIYTPQFNTAFVYPVPLTIEEKAKVLEESARRLREEQRLRAKAQLIMDGLLIERIVGPAAEGVRIHEVPQTLRTRVRELEARARDRKDQLLLLGKLALIRYKNLLNPLRYYYGEEYGLQRSR